MLKILKVYNFKSIRKSKTKIKFLVYLHESFVTFFLHFKTSFSLGTLYSLILGNQCIVAGWNHKINHELNRLPILNEKYNMYCVVLSLKEVSSI